MGVISVLKASWYPRRTSQETLPYGHPSNYFLPQRYEDNKIYLAEQQTGKLQTSDQSLPELENTSPGPFQLF